MNTWLGMLATVASVFVVIGIGALARRLNWLTEEADHSLIQVTVRILVPALILAKTLGNPSLMDPRAAVLPPIVGFVTITGGFALAALVAWLLRRTPGLTEPRQRRTFAFCIGLYNYYYVPLPLAEHLFRDNTVAILFVHNLGVEIAFWTIGILLVSGSLSGQWYRKVFNGPSITIVAALLLNFLGLHGFVPPLVMKALAMMGAAAVPVGLLLVGATLSDEWAGAKLRSAAGPISLGVILRLGILPVLFLLLLCLIPGSRELKQVIVLQAAMPCAVFPVIVARHYGGDAATAVRVVVATSVLSLLTTPAWLSAGLWLLKWVG